ncbi:hypothetical protein ACFE04_003759 [Oxalis oulophora]
MSQLPSSSVLNCLESRVDEKSSAASTDQPRYDSPRRRSSVLEVTSVLCKSENLCVVNDFLLDRPMSSMLSDFENSLTVSATAMYLYIGLRSHTIRDSSSKICRGEGDNRTLLITNYFAETCVWEKSVQGRFRINEASEGCHDRFQIVIGKHPKKNEFELILLHWDWEEGSKKSQVTEPSATSYERKPGNRILANLLK